MHDIEKELEWIREKGAEARAKREEKPFFERTEEELEDGMPYCARCHNGTKCNCQVQFPNGEGAPEGLWCACIGFISCPECPRKRNPIYFVGFTC